jgi:hypothetical protein
MHFLVQSVIVACRFAKATFSSSNRARAFALQSQAIDCEITALSIALSCSTISHYKRSTSADSSAIRRLSCARCDTPGVYFVSCREIYPNLGCSVKISISRSRVSLIIQTIHSHFTEFGVIQSHRRPNLEPIKTCVSEQMQTRKSFSIYKSRSKLI